MHFAFGRRTVLLVIALVLISVTFTDASAQKRRTKKSRRVTNPVTTSTQTPAATTSASTSDPQIISTADSPSYDTGVTTTTSRQSRSRRNSAAETGTDAPQDKVDRLSAQVSALSEKLGLMEQQQRTLVDLERLSRAETRAETMRAQLRDVQSKEAELQTRSLQLEYELQPTVIERTLASSGSTRPEELREQRRRQLETEKNTVQSQLNQLATSRARLETSIATSDAEADRLRARIDSALEPVAPDTTSTDVSAPPAPNDQAGDIGEGRP